jgi:hypothetical protein
VQYTAILRLFLKAYTSGVTAEVKPDLAENKDPHRLSSTKKLYKLSVLRQPRIGEDD